MTLVCQGISLIFSYPSIFLLREVTYLVNYNLTHFYHEGMCLSKTFPTINISTQQVVHTLSSGFLEVLCVTSEAIAFNRPSVFVEHFTPIVTLLIILMQFLTEAIEQEHTIARFNACLVQCVKAALG